MSLRLTPGLLSSGSFLGCACWEKMYSHMLLQSKSPPKSSLMTTVRTWYPPADLLKAQQMDHVTSLWKMFYVFWFFAFEHMFGCRHTCTCVWRVISCQAFTWVLETKPGSLCLGVLQCEPSLQGPAWFPTPPEFSVDPCSPFLWLDNSEEEFGFVHWFWPSVLETFSVYSIHTALLLTRGEAAVVCEPGRMLLTSWKLGSKEKVKGRGLGQQKLLKVTQVHHFQQLGSDPYRPFGHSHDGVTS